MSYSLTFLPVPGCEQSKTQSSKERDIILWLTSTTSFPVFLKRKTGEEMLMVSSQLMSQWCQDNDAGPDGLRGDFCEALDDARQSRVMISLKTTLAGKTCWQKRSLKLLVVAGRSLRVLEMRGCGLRDRGSWAPMFIFDKPWQDHAWHTWHWVARTCMRLDPLCSVSTWHACSESMDESKSILLDSSWSNAGWSAWMRGWGRKEERSPAVYWRRGVFMALKSFGLQCRCQRPVVAVQKLSLSTTLACT